MTQAQKTAKAKFKQAIAYRQKTGVSLKEAFAHIYRRKVGAVKKKAAPKKKAAKKVVKKKVAKKKVAKKVAKKKYGLNPKKDKLYEAKKPGKRIAKKSKKTYYENRPNRSDKGKLLGIGALSQSALQDVKKILEDIQRAEKGIKMNQTYTKKPIIKKNVLIKLKNYIKEKKTHLKELKKLI